MLLKGRLLVSVLPGLGDVRERFSRADPAWLAVTFACALGSTLSYVVAVRGTMSRCIGWRASWNLGMAEQRSDVLLPTGGIGGPALGARVMRRAGVPTVFAAPRSAALFLLRSATTFAAIAVAGTATGVGLLGAGSPGSARCCRQRWRSPSWPRSQRSGTCKLVRRRRRRGLPLGGDAALRPC